MLINLFHFSQKTLVIPNPRRRGEESLSQSTNDGQRDPSRQRRAGLALCPPLAEGLLGMTKRYLSQI